MTEAVGTAPGAIRPADLRNYEGVLYVKNNCTMKISFDDDKGTIVSIPAKDREDSIQVLPLPMAINPGFQKMWRRGEVIVSTDPAIEEELFLMEQRATEARDKDREDIFAVMESPAEDRDLVPTRCLHCQKTCFVTAKSQKENIVPILCEDHKDLVNMFVPNIIMDPSGKEFTEWVAVNTTPTQKLTQPK